MEHVLKLDKDCEEAANDLFYCKVLQLMVSEGVESVFNIHIFGDIKSQCIVYYYTDKRTNKYGLHR